MSYYDNIPTIISNYHLNAGSYSGTYLDMYINAQNTKTCLHVSVQMFLFFWSCVIIIEKSIYSIWISNYSLMHCVAYGIIFFLQVIALHLTYRKMLATKYSARIKNQILCDRKWNITETQGCGPHNVQSSYLPRLVHYDKKTQHCGDPVEIYILIYSCSGTCSPNSHQYSTLLQ